MGPKFSTLVAETITKVSAETISTTSREVVLAWLNQGYKIRLNFKTGKPDIKGFCQDIYSNFGDLLVRQEKNPAKYKNFATVDKDGPSKVLFPEQLRVARGMKAVFEWLNVNIDSLVYEDVVVVIDEKEVIKTEPQFKYIEKGKELPKVLSELAHLSKSELLTTEERASISKISARLEPLREAATNSWKV